MKNVQEHTLRLIVAASLVSIAGAQFVMGGVENIPKWIYLLNIGLAATIMVIVFRSDKGKFRK